MERVLYVLLDKWADWEFAYVASLVNELGGGTIENKTLSISREPVKSIGGLTCLPDYCLDDMPQDYAALILIGGMSWRGEAAEKITPLVDDCMKKGKILGAICDASRFAARVGALNKVKHTGNGADELASAGGKYSNAQGFLPKQAVSDGGVVTANGTAALEFAREIAVALGLDKKKIDAWYTFYRRGFFAEQ